MSCIPRLTELAAIEREFAAMTNRLKPLTIDGADLGHGLPAPVPLTELRARLLDRSAPNELKQAIWSVLARNAQTEGPEWTVAATTAMMAAALRTAVFRASRPCPQLRSDLESEIVAGFLHALLRTDPAAPRPADYGGQPTQQASKHAAANSNLATIPYPKRHWPTQLSSAATPT